MKIATLFIVVIVIVHTFLISITTTLGNNSQKSNFEGEMIFDRADGGFHIFKINGTVPDKEIRLTNKEANNYEPKWSPDGKHIAYINRGPNGKNNICIMDSDGKNKKKIVSMEYGIIFNIRWLKTGNELWFTYNPNRPGSKIIEKEVDIGTGSIRNISTSEQKLKECDRPILSPNEGLLICMKWLMPSKERLTIYQTETGEVTKTNKKISKPRNQGKNSQGIISYKGIVYKKKTEMILENASDPLWSSDSLRFAILIGSQLTIFDKNGSKTVRVGTLCKNEGASCLRTWSQDSKRILYSCYCGAEEIQEKIYIYDLETKKSIYITEGQNPDWYFPAR